MLYCDELVRNSHFKGRLEKMKMKKVTLSAEEVKDLLYTEIV